MQIMHNVRSAQVRVALATSVPRVPKQIGIMLGRAERQVALVTAAGQPQTVEVGAEAWMVLWPVFQIAKRMLGADTVQRAAVLLDDEQIYAGSPAEVKQWLTNPAPIAGADRTDSGAAPELRPEDSTALVPLGRTFDPVLLYDGAPPAGVRILAIESQDGVLAVIDGPAAPGSPVINPSVKGFVDSLMADALKIPGAESVVISVATHQVYAASRAAATSAVIRQALPVRREATAMERAREVAAVVPRSVYTVYETGARWAGDPRAVARTVSFAGFLITVALVIFLVAMFKKLSMEPIEEWFLTNPQLSTFASSAYGVVIFGQLVTLALVISLVPGLAQVLGILFSRSGMFGVYAFWVASGFDIFVNMQNWMQRLFAASLADIYAEYGTAVGVLAHIGSLVISALLALVSSAGLELGTIMALTLAVALFPGFIAAIGETCYTVCVRWPMLAIRGVPSLGTRARRDWDAAGARYMLPDADPVYVVIDEDR